MRAYTRFGGTDISSNKLKLNWSWITWWLSSQWLSSCSFWLTRQTLWHLRQFEIIDDCIVTRRWSLGLCLSLFFLFVFFISASYLFEFLLLSSDILFYYSVWLRCNLNTTKTRRSEWCKYCMIDARLIFKKLSYHFIIYYYVIMIKLNSHLDEDI